MTNVSEHDSGHADGGANTEKTESNTLGRQANKGILAKAVAEELDVPRRAAARILDAVLDSVRDLLRDQGRVAIKGFGTFERKIRKGRAYKHPLTGESIEVADKETVLFKPSDALISDTRQGGATRRRKAAGSRTEDVLFRG
ncbi:MAG: HU family DNA-binding protein [Planctomycetota bacterium]